MGKITNTMHIPTDVLSKQQGQESILWF